MIGASITITDKLAERIGRMAANHPDSAVTIRYDDNRAETLWEISFDGEDPYIVNDQTGDVVWTTDLAADTAEPRYQVRYRDGYYVVIDTTTGEVVPSPVNHYKRHKDGYLWDNAAAHMADQYNAEGVPTLKEDR